MNRHVALFFKVRGEGETHSKQNNKTKHILNKIKIKLSKKIVKILIRWGVGWGCARSITVHCSSLYFLYVNLRKICTEKWGRRRAPCPPPIKRRDWWSCLPYDRPYVFSTVFKTWNFTCKRITTFCSRCLCLLSLPK